MQTVDEYVEPISGEEIVVDLCSLLAEKLRADCNLRASDAYSGGYYAKISIHLEAYGMDVATVDAEVSTGKQQDNPDELLNTTMEIPVEPALNIVRERSDQPVPTLTANEGGVVEVRPRRYVRGDKKVQAQGGATGETL
jgi:hypothetical protein